MKKTGFTLVEIMIVVAIIAILAAIAIPQLVASRKASRQSRCLSNLKVANYAVDQYALQEGLTSGTVMTDEQVEAAAKYVKDAALLVCPSNEYDYATGGVAVGSPLSCSLHGTVTNPTALENVTD